MGTIRDLGKAYKVKPLEATQHVDDQNARVINILTYARCKLPKFHLGGTGFYC
jgi:hypothetical protein